MTAPGSLTTSSTSSAGVSPSADSDAEIPTRGLQPSGVSLPFPPPSRHLPGNCSLDPCRRRRQGVPLSTSQDSAPRVSLPEAFNIVLCGTPGLRLRLSATFVPPFPPLAGRIPGICGPVHLGPPFHCLFYRPSGFDFTGSHYRRCLPAPHPLILCWWPSIVGKGVSNVHDSTFLQGALPFSPVNGLAFLRHVTRAWGPSLLPQSQD